MSLGIYFVEDIARILHAVNDAGGVTTAMISEELERQLGSEEIADHLRIYRRGYKDALAAVAVAFGISPCQQLTSGEGAHTHQIDWVKGN